MSARKCCQRIVTRGFTCRGHLVIAALGRGNVCSMLAAPSGLSVSILGGCLRVGSERLVWTTPRGGVRGAKGRVKEGLGLVGEVIVFTVSVVFISLPLEFVPVVKGSAHVSPVGAPLRLSSIVYLCV